MASTNVFIATPHAGEVPAHGTFPALANTLYAKGTIVTQDANGRANSPATSDASGLPAVGVAMMTYDNRTTAESGGANDAIDIEVDYGVFGFAFTGTQPKPGDKLYVVDNQTVSLSDNGGTRGFAGICSEVRAERIGGSLKAFVFMGPHVPGSPGVGANPTTLERLNIFSALTGGAPMAAFVNGASAVPGTEFTDSKICSVRWNNNATLNPIQLTVYLPAPADPAAPAVLHLHCSKVGATLADATTFTVQAFAATVGGLHDAGSDMGGTSSAIVGNAATKTVQESTLTLTGANLPDGACELTITIQPTNGTLGTDDLCLHTAYITR